MPIQIEEIDAERGRYKVNGMHWKVGSRYKLLEHAGSGTYAVVCKAEVKKTSQLVAIKMVPCAMLFPHIGKQVLREVCIMRRLSHPNLLSLIDVFTRSSPRISGGRDVYIVTEYADRGTLEDIHNRNLSPDDVKTLMRQMLEGIQYMHSCGVWHRDVKPNNILLISPMTVKISDFNLSRYVEEASENSSEEAYLERSFLRQRCYTNIASENSSEEHNNPHVILPMQRHCINQVITKYYHAPEVFMSKGEYTSSIDMWSLGCIFWELLQCSISVDDKGVHLEQSKNYSFNKELEVSKAFDCVEKFITDKERSRMQMLNDIFDITGTPSLKDIQNISSNKWRKYLENLDKKVGKLYISWDKVDSKALDLLYQMLCFNPSHRCTAKQALAHPYFKDSTNYVSIPIRIHDVKHLKCELQEIEEELQRSIEDGTIILNLKNLLRNEINQQEDHSFQEKGRKKLKK